MPNTPLNPDALKWLTYIEDAIKDAGYNCNCATTPDNVSIDKDWLDYHLRELKKALLAVAQPEVNSVELDRLPIGSIVLDATGTTRTYVASEHGAYYADCYGEDGVLELPARVLYRPEVNDGR